MNTKHKLIVSSLMVPHRQGWIGVETLIKDSQALAPGRTFCRARPGARSGGNGLLLGGKGC